MVQAVKFQTAFLMHLFKMQSRAVVLCLQPEAHGNCVLVPWSHGSSWAENPQQWFPFPAPDCSCQHLSITGWLRLECSSGGHLLQSPCSSRVAQSQLPSTVSRQLFNISKNGESTSSLGNLCSAWSLSQ